MADVEVLGPASWNTLVHLDRLPEPRPHTVFARESYDTVGGTSAGKALHLCDQGRDVRLTTVVGDDDAGYRIVEGLRAAGVDVDATVASGASERHANLMTERGERISIYLSVPAVPAEAVPALGNRLTAARAVVVDLAGWTREIVELGRTRRELVWTDIHDYDGSAEFHRPFIDAASHVFLNADGLGAPGDFMHGLVDDGVQVVVCTLGSEGAMAVDAEHREWRAPAVPVERIVDTNGAGDAFFAGFLDAALDGAGVQRSLEAGASQATRALGTRHLSPLLEGLPTE